ncbi:response regulator [Limisalsivibrio acetivorans]|uniref:response regulator n=1 Tax=Limisalsivibrio acetivorans TaxID=1304888 RepID=UPI001EE37E42|nr:response regulator [Limisalsivibrio acetivorans]
MLVIDDDESLRLLLRDEFCDRNFNVITASDGEEGLVSFNEADVDIVVLDLNIPKILGEEVLQRLKAESPDVPIIIYTANPDMLFDTDDFMNVDVVFKSTDVDELMNRAERLLDAV